MRTTLLVLVLLLLALGSYAYVQNRPGCIKVWDDLVALAKSLSPIRIEMVKRAPDAASQTDTHQAEDQKSQMVLSQERKAFEQIHAVDGNYQNASAQARAEKKLVLLYFTGSDWSPSCKLLDQGVLSTEAFENFCGANLEFVTIDFPQHSELPADQKLQNSNLVTTFNVSGYPTLILATPDGKELGRFGYDPGSGPNGLIAKLQPLCPTAVVIDDPNAIGK